jgi:hypothetical protein
MNYRWEGLLGGIPSHYTIDLDLVSPVDLTGIPTSFKVDINSLPKMQIGLDPITLNPVDVSVRLKEIPSVRAHIPAAFTVGFSVLGLQVASIRLCGEAQVITEPYIPNPCELCGGTVPIQNTPVPQPSNSAGAVSSVSIARTRRRKGK